LRRIPPLILWSLIVGIYGFAPPYIAQRFGEQIEASTETVMLTTQSLCLQLLRLMRGEEGGGGYWTF